jgi:hypothetical protein
MKYWLMGPKVVLPRVFREVVGDGWLEFGVGGWGERKVLEWTLNGVRQLGCKQQRADSRQQTAENRQQTEESRQQTGDSRKQKKGAPSRERT